jgi:carbon-monoxide dehydrogenase medium subunit
MLNLRDIQKPTTIADALAMLEKPGTVALAGGTALHADKRRDVQAVIDLSGLGLSYIKESNGAIAIGATSTLTSLAESPILRALAKGILAQAAFDSASSILRNQSTVAGTLISEPDGILAVAFLALDARVHIAGKESRTVPMEDFLQETQSLTHQAIVTEIAVPMANPRASMQTVARTPSDKAIVSAIASAQISNGVARDARISLGGVANFAVRVKSVEVEIEGKLLGDALVDQASAFAAQGLTPQSDFRGSAEYRKEMAIVLTRRALKELFA